MAPRLHAAMAGEWRERRFSRWSEIKKITFSPYQISTTEPRTGHTREPEPTHNELKHTITRKRTTGREGLYM